MTPRMDKMLEGERAHGREGQDLRFGAAHKESKEPEWRSKQAVPPNCQPAASEHTALLGPLSRRGGLLGRVRAHGASPPPWLLGPLIALCLGQDQG